MRYYEREHFDAYALITRRGLDQWSDLHEQLDGFHDFPNRAFLERVLPPLRSGQRLSVLEYGCGTAPASCFLAERGYDVRGVDLVPDAIDLARAKAAEYGLAIQFEVEDICAWTSETETYDIVLDSFCLQSIVLDRDRATVLSGVRRRLKTGGRYVLSTVVFDRGRDYGDDYFESATGTVWMPTNGDPQTDARQIGPGWYLPHRRHLTAEALRAELEAHGFKIVEQSPAGGDLVCTVDRGPLPEEPS